jgi:hypothetical protein
VICPTAKEEYFPYGGLTAFRDLPVGRRVDDADLLKMWLLGKVDHPERGHRATCRQIRVSRIVTRHLAYGQQESHGWIKSGQL